MTITLGNSYLDSYMQMVEETESPRLFHLWVAISIMSATLGRRCYLPRGSGKLFANQYVVLVGNPGTRKSSALRIGARLLKNSTGIKIAPTDTSGHKQGLVKVMARGSESDPNLSKHFSGPINDELTNNKTMAELAGMNVVLEPEFSVYDKDRQNLVAVADEFTTLVGQNAISMLNFLTSTWDGTEYTYETQEKSVSLKEPLLSIIGLSTPSNLSMSLPKGAGGQGLLSRVILVFGQEKYKHIAWPGERDKQNEYIVGEIIENAYRELNGKFGITDEAIELSTEIYDKDVTEIIDTRFAHYIDRRFDHLLKISMALAATRVSMTIEKNDIELAHRILRATELGMPDALGEFGMSALASLKQSMLEFVREQSVVEATELRMHFSRDSRSNDFAEALQDLVVSKQFLLQKDPKGKIFIAAKYGKQAAKDQEIINMLSGQGDMA